MVTAHELSKRRRDRNLPVYLIGSPGLKRTLDDAGIESFGVGPDPVENYSKVDQSDLIILIFKPNL